MVDYMMNDPTLSVVIQEVVKEIDQLDKQREELIQVTRKLNRISGKAIAMIVKSKPIDDHVKEANGHMERIVSLMKNLGELTSWSTASAGVEEFVEMRALLAIVNRSNIPTPNELQVPPWTWILGVADVIGELRRMILNHLIDKDYEEVRYLLGSMQMLYEEFAGLDFSKSITGALRKKIDVSRALIERTETDVLYFLKT